MRRLTGVRRRTITLVAVAVAGVIVAVGAYVGHRLSTGGEVTVVGVDDALDRFREQVGASSASVPSPPTHTPDATPTTAVVEPRSTTTEPTSVSLPAPGVYLYATTGFDQIDALNGARHEYPSITTITVIPYDCGVQLRWDVAIERWDTWDWCLDGDAIRQSGWVGYHEFFGVAGQNDNTCDGDARPLDAPAGTTWSMTCRMGDRTTSSFTGTALGRTTLTVADTSIPVQHLRYDVDVVGESTGTQVVEGWYRTSDGLPVREQLTISTRQSTVIGMTNFEEIYTIELLTPTPAS
jgi:hypothetical protein